MKTTTTPASAKQNWTAFELLMLAPFGLLLWYIGAQPLVLPAAPPVTAIVADEQAVAASVAPTDPDAPVLVTVGTSVDQRIAPVARLALEAQDAVTAPQEPAQVQVSETSAVAVQAAVEPQEAASIRIEITDGTGIDGFAGELASQLEKVGVTVSKTANMAAGAQRRTVILYRDGSEEVAQRLSKLFTHSPALVNNTRSRNLSDTSDVRLVLGSAAARDKALLASKRSATDM